MKKIILILSLLPIFNTYSYDCVKGNELKEAFTEKVKIKVFNHTLTYKSDTCGAHGCEVQIFTQVGTTCLVNSLNVKGFYKADTLSPRSVTISIDGRDKLFTYNAIRGLFE